MLMVRKRLHVGFHARLFFSEKTVNHRKCFDFTFEWQLFLEMLLAKYWRNTIFFLIKMGLLREINWTFPEHMRQNIVFQNLWVQELGYLLKSTV